MIRLTKKQRELLDFIREHTEEKGIAPSVSEMAVATKASRSLVSRRLDALYAKRRIRREQGKARSVTVIFDHGVHNNSC